MIAKTTKQINMLREMFLRHESLNEAGSITSTRVRNSIVRATTKISGE